MAIPLRIKNTSVRMPVVQVNVAKRRVKNWRLWLGVAMVLFSIFSTSQIIATAGARSDALRVLHDVAAGSMLTEADVSAVRVALPSDISYVQTNSEVIGRYATRNLYANDLLQSNAVSATVPTDFRTVSVPIRAGHLPPITHGSFVDLWVTPSTQGLAVPGPPILAVSRAVVSSVPEGVDANSDTAVSLLIPNTTVPKLMSALRDGLIDLAVLGQGDGS